MLHLHHWSPEKFAPSVPACLARVPTPPAATRHLARLSPAGICPQHLQGQGSPSRGEIRAPPGRGELPVPAGRAPRWRVTRPPPGRAGTLPSSPSPHPGAAAQGLYLFRSSCLCSSLCRCSCGCHCWAGSSLGSHTGWRSTGRWLQGGSKKEALTASDTPASAAAQGCSCVLLPPSPVSQW